MCSSVFSVFPNQTSSSQFTSYLPRSSLDPGPEPGRFRRNRRVRLASCYSEVSLHNKMQTIMLLSGAARNQNNRDGVNREDGEDHNFISSLPAGTRNT